MAAAQLPPDAVLKLPASPAATFLGYVQARDEVAKTVYAMLAIREDSPAGRFPPWKLKITAKGVAGANFDPFNRSFRSTMGKAAKEGSDYCCIGARLAPANPSADARSAETRVYFDAPASSSADGSHGTADGGESDEDNWPFRPTRVELRLRTRLDGGEAGEEQVASFAWPSRVEDAAPPRLLSLPRDTATAKCKELAYVALYDEVVDKDYAYVVWSEENEKTGAVAVKFKGSSTGGGACDTAQTAFRKSMGEAAARGETYVPVGFRLQATDSDPREVEVRAHFQEGVDGPEVTEGELRVVVRYFDGTAKPLVARKFTSGSLGPSNVTSPHTYRKIHAMSSILNPLPVRLQSFVMGKRGRDMHGRNRNRVSLRAQRFFTRTHTFLWDDQSLT
jgi:hypothetical protein